MAPAKDKEIRGKYGDYNAIDVSSYVMGYSDDIPEKGCCGCRISSNVKAELERCRSEFRHNEQEGKKLYALLGSFANGDAGPLVTARLDDGTIIVVMSPKVAESNPVMEVVDGNVKIRGSRNIGEEFREPPTNPSRTGRFIENISARKSKFKLVESVKAGVSISINSLRTYDYTLIHPHDKCKITRVGSGHDSRHTDSTARNPSYTERYSKHESRKDGAGQSKRKNRGSEPSH